MGWSYDNIDWDATAAGAAWAQAILSVAAVGAAAWLQDRATQKRQQEVRRQELADLSAIARFAETAGREKFDQVHDGMDPVGFLRVYSEGDLTPVIRAVHAVSAARLGDEDLIRGFIEMEMAVTDLERAFDSVREAARRQQSTGIPVNAKGLLGPFMERVSVGVAAVVARVSALT